MNNRRTSPGRAPVRMTPERQTATAAVQRAYQRYSERREAERPRVQAMLAEELDRRCARELEELRTEIRDALALGVPRLRLQTSEVLGSTDQGKIKRLLGDEAAIVKIQEAGSSFEWLDENHEQARVLIRGFATTSEASDYPEILSGVVEADPAAPGGWAVLADDSDEPDLPGFLRWELERDYETGHLGDMIGALASDAARR